MKGIITDVFFDLDHTLWDFDRNSALTFEKILTMHGVNIPLTDFLEVYVPLNAHYWKLFRENRITKEHLRYSRLERTFETLDYKIDSKLINVLSDDYIRILPEYNHLFEDAAEILQYLRPFYRLHIITNGFREVQDGKLKNSNIYDFFTHIINSEMVGVKKPDPKIFHFAMNKANVSAKNCVMIGDNLEADILGAKFVGMKTIHFNVNNEEIDQDSIVIHKLIEIKKYL